MSVSPYFLGVGIGKGGVGQRGGMKYMESIYIERDIWRGDIYTI